MSNLTELIINLQIHIYLNLTENILSLNFHHTRTQGLNCKYRNYLHTTNLINKTHLHYVRFVEFLSVQIQHTSHNRQDQIVLAIICSTTDCTNYCYNNSISKNIILSISLIKPIPTYSRTYRRNFPPMIDYMACIFVYLLHTIFTNITFNSSM